MLKIKIERHDAKIGRQSWTSITYLIRHKKKKNSNNSKKQNIVEKRKSSIPRILTLLLQIYIRKI